MLKTQGNKITVTSRYFCIFVVSLDVVFNLLFIESANSSILAAHRHFKRWWRKKSGFYANEVGQSQWWGH